MRVLIVDDHEIIWSGMRGVVERLAAQRQPPQPLVWFAARDVAATQALPIEALDLILLDYHRPGTSGLDAMRAMRERFESVVFEEFYQVDNAGRDRTRGLGLGLAIVARLISGDTDAERLLEAERSGLPLLHQPVTLERLREAMSAALAQPAGVRSPADAASPTGPAPSSLPCAH